MSAGLLPLTPAAGAARQGVARCLSLLPTAVRVTGEAVGEPVPPELPRLVEALALIGDGALDVDANNEALARVLFPGQYPDLDSEDEDEFKRALAAATRQVRRFRERGEEYQKRTNVRWVSSVMGYTDDDGNSHSARFHVAILDVLVNSYNATRERRSREWRKDPLLALEKALRPRLARLIDDRTAVVERHPEARELRAQTATAKVKSGVSHLTTAARLMRKETGARAEERRAALLGDDLPPGAAATIETEVQAFALEMETRAVALDAHAMLAERAADIRRSPRAGRRRDERGRAPSADERLDALAVAMFAELRHHQDPEAALAAVTERVLPLLGRRTDEDARGDSTPEGVPALVRFPETKCEEQKSCGNEGRTDLSAPRPPSEAANPEPEDWEADEPSEPDPDQNPYQPDGQAEIRSETTLHLVPKPASESPSGPPPRPIPPPVRVDEIPAEMRAASRWVTWRYELRQNRKGDWKWTKVPYAPRASDQRARSNDASTWGTWDEVLVAHELNDVDGIGFMLGGGWVGVDVDKCRDPETEALTQLAAEIVVSLGTYSEVSPSRTGVKSIARGELPSGGRNNRRLGVEMYSANRFFTVTGHRITEVSASVEERTEILAVLHAHIFPQAVALEQARRKVAEGRPEALEPTESDANVIAAAVADRGGDRVAALLDGDVSRYGSDSDADFALMCALAKQTKSPEQIDRIYRGSRLRRAKWDERHAADGSTYGEMTIRNAMARVAVEGRDRALRPVASLPSVSMSDKGAQTACHISGDRCENCDAWLDVCRCGGRPPKPKLAAVPNGPAETPSPAEDLDGLERFDVDAALERRQQILEDVLGDDYDEEGEV